MADETVSRQTLLRLPLYLNYLKSLPPGDCSNISATSIAAALGLGQVQVRKDLASISGLGRPKIGYIRSELERDIERFLGYDDVNSAVLVGAGKLGQALLSYGGFSSYGLNIVAAFDQNPSLVGQTIADKPVFPMKDLPGLCRRLGARIGILTVPAQSAQSACDALVQGGILAVWNFAPAHLTVPEGILVQNENMAASLAVLSRHLEKQQKAKQEG